MAKRPKSIHKMNIAQKNNKTRNWVCSILTFGLCKKLKRFFRFVVISTRYPNNFPHYLVAAFTLALAVFAYYAWDEATRGTKALQGQLDVLRTQQRAWVAPRGFASPPPNFANRIDLYTEATLGIENVGKEPALKVAEEIHPIALPKSDWNNPVAMKQIIEATMGNRGCKDVSLNQNGRVIWPGAKVGRVVGFSKPDTIKINIGSHYAMLAGCIVYETLKIRHESEVCVILESVIQDGGWRSINCTVYNQAN